VVEIEQVLVVPTDLFHKLGHFQGFTADVERYLDHLLDSEQVSYRPRDEMERDPCYKQLIPYVVFEHRDADGRRYVFAYTRGKGQGEGRLHSKRSVGVGGHISSLDGESSGRASGAANPYDEGLRRELDEEVRIDSPYEMRCVGLINDDLTEVGQVHLGVVHLCQVRQPKVFPREAEILEAGFRPVDQLLADLEGFETWSAICLRALYGDDCGGDSSAGSS